MDRKEEKQPFAFRPSPEALRYFRNASPEEKLNWLEEANRFVRDFVPADKLQRWEKIKDR